jgi:hypothetical protein
MKANMKYNLKVKFDLENMFTNYEGEALLSHHHEAAYDAYMTGFCFVHIIKYMQIGKALKEE